MRIEIINGHRVEFADEGNWLYKDLSETERVFTDYVYLGDGAEPWAECTTAEKEAWEREHPQPEQPEPENE